MGARDDGYSWGTVIATATLVALVLGYVLFTAGDTSAPLRALRSFGYSDARIEDSSILGELHGCAKNEIAYDASATNQRGERVRIVVCCGAFFKACTVRSR